MNKTGYYQGICPENNVAGFLEQNATARPQKTAFIFADKGGGYESMSYRELDRRAKGSGFGFGNLGIAAGDRVLVFLPISPELYISLAGLQRIGAVPVFIDSWARKEQMAAIMQNSKPIGAISTAKVFQMFGSALDAFGVRVRIAVGERCEGVTARLEEMFTGGEAAIAAVGQDDTGLITYTTGSSGAPKGVNRTHRFLAAQHYALKRLFPYSETDVDLPVFPVFALNNIASGITTVIPAGSGTETLVAQIRECKVGCMTLSPASFKDLAVYCESQKIVLDGLTRVLTGGAPIGETDIARFSRIAPNSKNWILYGSTEVEPIARIESKEMLSVRPAAARKNITETGVNVGRVDSELDFKLIRIDEGNVAPGTDLASIEAGAGEVGELIVAGEHVCSGYYDNEEAFLKTKIKDRSGVIWHRTGDLGRLDGDGYLWIVGRSHNIVRSLGSYFFPVRVEIMLKDLPGVSNAAYLAIERGSVEYPLAAIVLDDKSAGATERCRNSVIELLKKSGVPVKEVIFLDDIPMDVRHHSKVDYAKLRQNLYEILG